MFYQCETINHCTHVLFSVAQSSADSEYNTACTAGIALEHSRMMNNQLLNNDPYVVPEQAPQIILDRKSAILMSKNGKDTKHTRNISRRMHSARNCKECNLKNTVWCEGGLQLAYIVTQNFREDGLNARLGYDMTRLEKITEKLSKRGDKTQKSLKSDCF